MLTQHLISCSLYKHYSHWRFYCLLSTKLPKNSRVIKHLINYFCKSQVPDPLRPLLTCNSSATHHVYQSSVIVYCYHVLHALVF